MVDWQPAAARSALEDRARLLDAIRGFFKTRKVLEVETPLLSRAANTDPSIEQFRLQGGKAPWLRTSPEYPMKRLLAAGSGDIYELGRVFRHGESGRLHHPEFTLLEWYRLGWPYERLWGEVVELVNACAVPFGRHWEVRQQTYQSAFLDAAGVDPLSAAAADLQACATRHGLDIPDTESTGQDTWLDLLFSHLVQPRLPGDAMTVIHEYPASKAALARLKPGAERVAERFELFLGPVELANGFRELTDAAEQRARFETENRLREATGSVTARLDENLLAALASGLPECSGVALGVDRLLMACLGASRIDEVLAFPFSRA